MDGVQAEVVALKLLVITSTPSNPGKKGHRRAPSADQICAECETCHSVTDGWQDDSFAIVKSLEEKEVTLYVSLASSIFSVYSGNSLVVVDLKFSLSPARRLRSSIFVSV